MKKLLILSTAFFFSAAIMAQTAKVDEVAKFNEEKHDFGKIKQGVPAITYFEITNSSSKPIVIESASASCGCTVPEYPKEAIAPGTTSKIKVQYSAAAMGHFDKQVYIKLAGVTEQKTLAITGDVVAEQAAANSVTKVATPVTSNAAVVNSNANSQSKTAKPATTPAKAKTAKAKTSNK
jgi:hypothetical protein